MEADEGIGARWAGRASGPFLIATGALLLTGALTLLLVVLVEDDFAALLGAAVSLLIAALVVLAFVAVEVTIDRGGLRARSRPVGVARVHFELEEIEAVRVVDHRTLSWGISSGWGYRGSLRLFRRAAWVLRSGPALELDLTGRRRFTITVDDAVAGAAVLERLLLTRAG